MRYVAAPFFSRPLAFLAAGGPTCARRHQILRHAPRAPPTDKGREAVSRSDRRDNSQGFRRLIETRRNSQPDAASTKTPFPRASRSLRRAAVARIARVGRGIDGRVSNDS